MYQTKILGTGSYLPTRILSNDELAKTVDTNDQWISERTGIKNRRIADPKNDLPSDMGARAAQRAIEQTDIDPNQIDLILTSVTIGDMYFPNTACLIQEKLGINTQIGALDISAACSGWIYGLVMADGLIRSGLYQKILLIGVEMTSSFNNWSDRSTCILFGDGAGAVILGRSEDGQSEILASILGADPSKKEALILPGGGAAMPLTQGLIDSGKQFVSMNGQEVFKAAVKTIALQSEYVLKQAQMNKNQVDWFIPHQANMRIIEAAARRLEFPANKIISHVEQYANTSSASIPIAIDENFRSGVIKRGDILLMPTFGAGLTSGCSLVRF